VPHACTSIHRFLRSIWLECCEHLSQFVIDGVVYLSHLDAAFWGNERSMTTQRYPVRTSSFWHGTGRQTFVAITVVSPRSGFAGCATGRAWVGCANSVRRCMSAERKCYSLLSTRREWEYVATPAVADGVMNDATSVVTNGESHLIPSLKCHIFKRFDCITDPLTFQLLRQG